MLVPTLGRGDVVIMDNLGSHKGPAIRRAVRNVGAKLILLPKYSSDAVLGTYSGEECANYLRNSGYGQT